MLLIVFTKIGLVFRRSNLGRKNSAMLTCISNLRLRFSIPRFLSSYKKMGT